ncbi:FtsX-like permease family protein [uncultured Treponema sp.]|uniref:ABC transporter permease n=1 Tax=uncultured Treponema sp. TaxID=162155 RepID=UPI0025DEDB26|nr:FtsX-like permease family protein [uncultured Treponema sp.]
MLLYLAFKNIISRKSSFVIILFIAFAVMMLVVTNSIFDSTEQGVQETFVSSFTGDIVIRPQYKSPLSLFGDETPVTGKLTELPNLIPYNEIYDYLSKSPFVSDLVPQVSGLSQLSSDSEDTKCYMFGVPAIKYLEVMKSIKIIDGKAWADGEKGIMLSQKYAQELNANVGDTLQFAISEGFSSRIRAVPLTAIYEYSVENTTLDKIVLTNPETVRAIMDMSDLSAADKIEISESAENMLSDSDLDDLFSDAEDMSEVVHTEEIKISQDDIDALQNSYTNSTSWNFLICRLKDSKDTNKVIKALNSFFKAKDWPCEAVNWRSSAGSTAFYLFILRLILNIGIIIILGAGFIVVNNTLVINVLDRIREIGTMRAIGANKRYITKECASETMIMAFAAGVLGCLLGVLASYIISNIHVSFSNSFLIQLFGGTVLHTSVKFSNILMAFSMSIFIGLIAWIYPLINAIRVNPVEAMQGVK